MADCPNNRCEAPVRVQPVESKNWQSATACDAYSRPGVTVAVDGQSKPDYDKMIKDNFKYTQDNYADAYKAAAREGKPIVAVFGSWEKNNTRGLIQDTLPKSGTDKDAIYLYIDPTKCTDKNLKAFADGQLAGGHNAAVSIVFNVKPDENGKPQPTEYSFRWQGGDKSMVPSFKEALGKSQKEMDKYKDKFSGDVPMGPPAPTPEQLKAQKAQEETAHKAAELQKAQEETARKSAELQKAQEEAARKTAEAQKAIEEATRKTAEAQKIIADDAALKAKLETAAKLAFPIPALTVEGVKLAAPVIVPVVNAAVDHVKDHPTRTAVELIAGGPVGPAIVATDIVVNNPTVQKVAGVVYDAAKAEAVETLKAATEYPLMPFVGLGKKGIKDGLKLFGLD